MRLAAGTVWYKSIKHVTKVKIRAVETCLLGNAKIVFAKSASKHV